MRYNDENSQWTEEVVVAYLMAAWKIRHASGEGAGISKLSLKKFLGIAPKKQIAYVQTW